MKVQLHPYTPAWKFMFKSEKARISNALKELSPEIEHIGSTSVEGLAAKPVIDIQVGVSKEEDLDKAVPLMIDAGYIYAKKYEDELPYRRYFFKVQNTTGEELPKILYTHDDHIPRENFPHLFHIHMVELNTEWWKRHLAFRDYLRKNPEERDNYYKLKAELAERDWDTVNDYAGAKTEYIRGVEKKAME